MFMDARDPPKDLAGYDPIATAGDTYKYDPEDGEKAILFFSHCLSHVKDSISTKSGEQFQLSPWQADINRTAFGWKIEGTNIRRYRTVFVFVPRKNGKTTWVAGNSNYVLFSDGEGGAECYCSATTADQARLVFDQAAGMIRNNKEMESVCKIRDSMKRVIYQNSFFHAIPCNEGASHGYNSHWIVYDEFHEQTNRGFYDVLHTSTGAREQPLEWVITTAGWDRTSVCYEMYEYAKQVRDGKIDDPTFLPVIYEAEESDDWTDPQVWAKCNPNLNVSVSENYIARECEKAKLQPAYENAFRRLHLNQWTSQETRWLPMEHWRKCQVTENELDGIQIGGLDLSAVADFTAWMRIEKRGDGIACRGHYFLPEDAANEYARSQNMPIAKWVQDGWLTLTPQRYIEHSYIHRRITQDCERFKIRAIGYDKWNMEQLRQTLESEGHDMVEVAQGYSSLSGPSKELERQVLAHTLDHGNDPVLEWMADNAVSKVDENGNVRPVKGKGKHKIDGIVALIIAIHVMQALEPRRTSAYETAGML